MSEDTLMQAVLNLNDLRRSVLEGKEVSATEYARLIEELRAAREAAPKRKRPGKAKNDADPA
jgi:hypothetical protein